MNFQRTLYVLFIINYPYNKLSYKFTGWNYFNGNFN